MEQLIKKIELYEQIKTINNKQFENKYLESIQNDFDNYKDIIKIFKTLTIKKINKLIKSLKKKIQLNKSLKELILFYNEHTMKDSDTLDLFKYILHFKFEYETLQIEEILSEIHSVEEDDKVFIWRDNQTKAFLSAIHSDFCNGIHSQATGSGKSLIALKICGEYNKKYPTHNICWLCERKDISEKLFFETNKGNTLSLCSKSLLFWKKHDIINLNNFNVIEMIEKKPKNYFNIINENKDKPYFLIINRAFLTTKVYSKDKKDKKDTYKYQKIKNKSQLCIIDECHSSQSSETYKVLLYMKHQWKTKIQGFSATPYRHGKSHIKNIEQLNLDVNNIDNLDTIYNDEKLIQIFHKQNNTNLLNVISWFNMKEAIESGVILEPIFHWFQMNISEDEEKEESKIKITYNDKEKEIIFKVLNEIVSQCKYKKIVCWCKKIDNTEKWYDDFKKEKCKYPNLKDMKEYIDHSKSNSTDYNDFYYKNDGILFCAVKHREGSDIPFLSIEMFLDKVKRRGALPLIQHIGRVLRKDEQFNLKTNGHVIDGLTLTTNSNENTKMKELLNKILKYYIDLYDICIDEKSDVKSEIKSNVITTSKLEQYHEIIDNLNINTETKKVILKLKNDKQMVIDISNIDLKAVSWTKLTKKFDRLLKDTIILSDYEEFILFKKHIQTYKFKSKEDYGKEQPKIILKNDKMQIEQFIVNPEELFSFCWKGWTDFLGLDCSSYPKNKKEWLIKCKNLNITNTKQYFDKQKTNIFLPLYPEEFYKKDNFKNLYYELS